MNEYKTRMSFYQSMKKATVDPNKRDENEKKKRKIQSDFAEVE